jgi:hypothetical protein
LRTPRGTFLFRPSGVLVHGAGTGRVILTGSTQALARVLRGLALKLHSGAALVTVVVISGRFHQQINIHVQQPRIPPKPAPHLTASAQSLSFTAQMNSTSADQTAPLTISNTGPAGTSLSYTVSSASGRVSVSGGGSPIAGGGQAALILSYNTAGLQSGTTQDALVLTSNDPSHPSLSIPIAITVASSTHFVGSFTGHVTNDDFFEDFDDADFSFTDSYGGPVTATLQAKQGGGFTLTLSGSMATTNPHFEDFAAFPNISIPLSNLASIFFSFAMGDGVCNAQGAINNGVFAGTWTFARLFGSSDFSDSGQGSFSLHIG